MHMFFAILVIVATAPFAHAKCGIPVVSISGKVTDGDGAAIEQANVAVSWVRRGVPQGPAQARTSGDGAFLVEFQFNTFTKNSSLRGDVCREVLTHVSVSAFAPGYHPEYRLIPLVDWSASAHLRMDAVRQ